MKITRNGVILTVSNLMYRLSFPSYYASLSSYAALYVMVSIHIYILKELFQLSAIGSWTKTFQNGVKMGSNEEIGFLPCNQ